MDSSPDLALQPHEPETEPRQHLDRTGSRAMTRMRLDIDWTSTVARHRDGFVASRINLWRDLFPPELDPQILDKPVGHRAAHGFDAGELIAPWQDGLLLRIRSERFDRRFTGRGLVHPRTGRFYPKGILAQVAGVFRTDLHPFRVIEVTEPELILDFNHPLADKSLELAVTIEEIWAQGQERGGRCNEILDLVTGEGPGMQARWREVPTDFWSDRPFLRRDPRPDAEFYRKPRLVDHLDSTALAQLTELYRTLIPPGAQVLDLMASGCSHLPDDLELRGVSGLGMNAEELASNPRLAERTVQDLNLDPRLPHPDGAFDVVICSLSVEYLIQPFEVFAEVGRVLRQGGHFILTFSNRWFPPTVVQIWEGIHEFERPGLVLEYFLRADRYRDLQTWSLRGLPRPAADKYADRLATSDPLYAVWGERA